MLLNAPPSAALPVSSREATSFPAPSLSLPRRTSGARAIRAAAAPEGATALTGVIFHPFLEVQKELSLVPAGSTNSLARHKYADNCEAAINEQINVEYNISYAYHAMFAYFDRDNIALKGMAKFFQESSEEEREHAEKLMKYQNKRGGRVKLMPIVMPPTEFYDEEKGDALRAMELALSFEKLVNEKLLALHKTHTYASLATNRIKNMITCFGDHVDLITGKDASQIASDANDVQLTDFIESEFLSEQVDAIKKISEYVSQLRRVGTGHGVWHFDQMLLKEGDAK